MMERRIRTELRRRGYKLTPQRRAIISIIGGSDEHLTPGDIYAQLKSRFPGIGLVTVYRTLELLQEGGMLCEVHIGNSCRSYLGKRRTDAHHHHLECSECGRVVDFAGCQLEELQKKLAEKTGFEIDRHLLEFMGRCKDCRKKTG